MPAERASVTDSPAIPTHNEPNIHQDGRSGLRLALILVASFMVVLDFTIVNIAPPSMERDFGATLAAPAATAVAWHASRQAAATAARSA